MNVTPMIVEIAPTGAQALGVVTALGELAAEQRLHVRGVSVVQADASPTRRRTSDALSVVQLYVTASIVGIDRTTPAAGPDAQRLLREMGAAWDDLERPRHDDDGHHVWAAALAGQGIHLTLTTRDITAGAR